MKLEYVIGSIIGLIIVGGVLVYMAGNKMPLKDVSMETSNGEVMRGSSTTSNGVPTKETMLTEAMKARQYPKAPELGHADAYLNTDGKEISVAGYKGKSVVLIDFWTYSCINCQRTLPYITSWYEKYKDQGLVVIGVHTPEFAFEKKSENVADALKRFGINYPVILDNEYATWNNFSNQYWPHKFLIDIDGYVVYDHAGEGNYGETESAIQKALKERAERLKTGTSVASDMTHPNGVMEVESNKVGSPEIYFGSSRNQYLSNGKTNAVGAQTLSVPPSPSLNALYLGGTWNFSPEYAESGVGGDIVFRFSSRDVYFVGSSKDGADVEITLDGKTLEGSAGADVKNNVLHVQEERLYKVIGGKDYGTHILKMHIKKGTLDAFTFTFG